MIHICYALYDKDGKYSKNTGTSMLSIFENTKEWITIHLFHDNTLTESNKALFIKLVRQYGHYISFYNMDELGLPCMKAIEELGAKARYSKAALYRLLVGEVLPSDVQRLIYLDSDIIVNLDIKELWEEDLKGLPLGALSEDEVTYHHMIPKPMVDDGTIELHRYFSSGLLLIDMVKFCEVKNLVKNGLEMLAKHPEYTLYDMDILNYYFGAIYQPLDIRYDLFVPAERIMGYYNIKSAIYHYPAKAFRVFLGDVFDRLWAKYYTMSPWFTGDTLLEFCRLSTSAMLQPINQFWRFVRGRTLAVVGLVRNNEDIEHLQKMFALQQGDRFLPLYDKNGHINIEYIIADMQKFYMTDIGRTKDVYLFFTPYYAEFSKKILAAGFKEGKDFIDATWLLAAFENNYPKGIEEFIWDNI